MKLSEMKVFISGPITGTDDYKERFAYAEELLEQTGCIPVNPVKATEHLPTNTSWEEYMNITLPLLKQCDGIYMLKDWRKSDGAVIEYIWACRTNKVFFGRV